MVGRILRFLGQETKGLHEAAYLLAFFAVLSQVLAFFRDRLLAHIFGASSTLDIYYAAFRVPDFIFVTAASIVSVSVLVPFIVEKEKESREEVKRFIGSIFSFFSVLIVSISLVAYFLMPMLSEFLFRGLSPEALSEVTRVSKLLLLSPILLGFSNLLGSLTQAFNRFAVYALAPLLYNIGIISGILLFGKELGAFGIALGVIIGALMHVLVQLPFVAKENLIPNSFKLDFSVVRKVAIISVPRTLTLSMNQIALIALVSFASLMSVGSVSVLSFSINLQSVPLTIIGVSYSLAAFPTLARYFADKNYEAFTEQMASTAKHIIFWALPTTALFVVLRAQIVRVLLGTGQFDWDATRLTAAALALFVISAVFQSLLILFMRAFYSAGHTKMPFVMNFVSTIVLIGSTIILLKMFNIYDGFRHFFSALLRVSDLENTAVLMLPLGYTIGTILNGLLHWVSFEKMFGGFSKMVWRTAFESVGASVIMGAGAYVGLAIFAPILNTATLIGIFLQGLLAGILGIIIGIIVLYALESKELKEVWSAIHSRFWKAKIIATDPEIV